MDKDQIHSLLRHLIHSIDSLFRLLFYSWLAGKLGGSSIWENKLRQFHTPFFLSSDTTILRQLCISGRIGIDRAENLGMFPRNCFWGKVSVIQSLFPAQTLIRCLATLFLFILWQLHMRYVVILRQCVTKVTQTDQLKCQTTLQNSPLSTRIFHQDAAQGSLFRPCDMNTTRANELTEEQTKSLNGP